LEKKTRHDEPPGLAGCQGSGKKCLEMNKELTFGAGKGARPLKTYGNPLEEKDQ